MRKSIKIFAVVLIAVLIAGSFSKMPVRAEDNKQESSGQTQGEKQSNGETGKDIEEKTDADIKDDSDSAGTTEEPKEGAENSDKTTDSDKEVDEAADGNDGEDAEEADDTADAKAEEDEEADADEDEEADADEEPEEASDPSVISPKAMLGSLGSNGADTQLLHEYDVANKITADADAVFEKKYEKMTYKKNGFSKKDLKLVSALIYCEANSMCFEAQVAVANVVLNRMNNTDPNVWGHCNTIYDVIYDRRWGVQFSPTDGNPSSMDKALALYSSMSPDEYENWQIRAMNRCIVAAKAALSGYKTVPDTFMYFNSHLQASREKCQNQGRPFSILERHIYYK